MIGYGAEDSHFILELTYNYGIDSYQLGNDFQVYVCVNVQPFDIATIIENPHGGAEGDL